MSELENYSLADEIFGEQPATYDDAPEETEVYDEGYGADDPGDDIQYEPEQPPDLAAMVTEALERGLGSTEAMLEARQRADAWWGEYQARTQYEQHVAEQAELASANEEAADLLEQAAKRHGVPQTWVDDGVLKQVANHLLLGEQQTAYDTGDVERLTWLRSPEGARAAIDEAGAQARLASFASLAHKGLGVEGRTESEARARRDWDDYARRHGVRSLRGVS